MPEHLKGFTTRRYINPLYLYLYRYLYFAAYWASQTSARSVRVGNRQQPEPALCGIG